MMKKRTGLIIFLLLLTLSAITLVRATQRYDLNWWTVDGGGVNSSEGENYSLGGTIGQFDAGILQGMRYTFLGGFWDEADMAVGQLVYLPFVLREH